MKIIISPEAEKRLNKLPKFDQIAVAKKIRSLAKEAVFPEKLKGFEGFFRVRVGDYRIVYRKTDEQIYIVLISHRKDVYDLFKRLFK